MKFNLLVKKLFKKMTKKSNNDGIKLNKQQPISNEASNLKELAKKIAQRKYNPEDNPAVKRLKDRFKKI
ncbi:hypothetical protein J2S11_002591 [Bacillus horti]|uniref:Uncharacterized protein n=2 Tax=Caldalkalibacillus horti TaxID=77523 RepID=A0ABT9W088_9BACI|nr:hypothetical protein [Bacillus horti]